MNTMALEDGIHSADLNLKGTVVVMEEAKALTASAIPVKPPTDWFANPNLKSVSPLTITSDGRVYGHIAAWHTSHIGMAGSVKPPKSRSNYAFFKTGVVETAQGDFIDVGQITLSGGHADLSATAASAVEHYDNTMSAVMDVNAGEDRHGIWVAGALRPGVTPEQIRVIRASAVSGDWRPINGRLELVAVCAVNCPGFPIPRTMVASGATLSLVAAGIEPIIEQALKRQAAIDIESGIQAGVNIFHERIRNVEAVLASAQMDQLRHRVRMPKPVTASADIAELRSRVHAKTEDSVVAALRQRVRSPRA